MTTALDDTPIFASIIRDCSSTSQVQLIHLRDGSVAVTSEPDLDLEHFWDMVDWYTEQDLALIDEVPEWVFDMLGQLGLY